MTTEWGSPGQEHGRWRQPLLWAGYALLLVLAPWLAPGSLSQSILSQIGIAIIICLSYNLLLGQGGMVSFGHAVYVGAGAFLAMHTLHRVAAGLALPVSLIPIAGGLGSLLLALALGWVCTRKSATPFAMMTFGVGELVWAVALMLPDYFGGEGGLAGNRVAGSATLGITLGPQIELYYLIAAYTWLCTALMYAFTRTPLGRMLLATRDNAQRVAFVGYNPHRVRYLAFVLSAFFAGIAGGLSALHYEIVSADVFSGARSGAYLLFTFVGGCTLFVGPIIGAVVMVLATMLLPGLTQAWLLYLGLLFVVMVMLAPGGLAALLQRGWQLARQGVLRQLWAPVLLLGACALIALAGLSVLIELAYHLQQRDALGPQLHWMGLALDSRSAWVWLAGGAALVLGSATLAMSRRHLQRGYDKAVADGPRGCV